MTPQILLSIIVPVYNTERFLPRCLDSLLRQGVEKVGEYEIICVDDGSTDGSREILERYARNHPGVFRILTQRNAGVAMARNAALSVARGKYVGFVDSDDYLIDGGLGYVCSNFLDGEPDVVSFWMVTMNAYQLSHWTYGDTPEGEVTWEGSGVEAFNQHRFAWVLDKLYQRGFLEEHGVAFPNLYVGEDRMFNFYVFRHDPYTVMTNANIYRYEVGNSLSLTRQKNVDNKRRAVEASLPIIAELNDYLQQGDSAMHEGVRKMLTPEVRIFYTRALAAKFSRKEWRDCMRRLRSHPYRTAGMEGVWTPVGWALNAISLSYVLYRFFAFLYCEVFNKYIRQRLP